MELASVNMFSGKVGQFFWQHLDTNVTLYLQTTLCSVNSKHLDSSPSSRYVHHGEGVKIEERRSRQYLTSKIALCGLTLAYSPTRTSKLEASPSGQPV